MPSSCCQLTPTLAPSYKNILLSPQLLKSNLLFLNQGDLSGIPPSPWEHTSLHWHRGQDGCHSSSRSWVKSSCAPLWAGTLHWKTWICSFLRQFLASVVGQLQNIHMGLGNVYDFGGGLLRFSNTELGAALVIVQLYLGQSQLRTAGHRTLAQCLLQTHLTFKLELHLF